ncbi:MAG: DUF1566 domain-containing protein [Deferribacteres bacterium]|nr:DUF1566 domain-containing protein [Deferribacteres bacterium]
MSPDSTSVLSILTNPVQVGTALLAIIGALATIAKLISTVTPWISAWHTRRSIKKRLGAELYLPEEIRQATRYYVRPMTQNLDPAHAMEPGQEAATREDLFKAMDRLLYERTDSKYIVLLADSGMGKSAFSLNYYARYLGRRKRFYLHLIPLGRQDADEKIKAIADKHDKVLFLDALDEDVLAIVDHNQRIRDLCDMTKEFQKVLITCRTQFFPKAAEEPGRTGVIKISDGAAGKKSEYLFHKLYLSPFEDKQVNEFLRKRYSFFQRGKRKKAQTLVDKIPRLSARPMLLGYIDDLLDNDKKYDYAYQIYEQMVDAWLEREEGKVENLHKEPLREFCELLAIELYSNKERYKDQRMPIEEINQLAADFYFTVETWKLSGRSLLNRDAEDRFKFAHRSIMEYLFVKKFLELPAANRPEIAWTDQMGLFVYEMIEKQVKSDKDISFILDGVDKTSLTKFCNKANCYLRSSAKRLSTEQTKLMLVEHGFYDSSRNKDGKGITHYYIALKREECDIVFDIVTGLYWQRSGTPKFITYKQADDYIAQLNRDKFAGFTDWRLPTLEEAMSLMEPMKKHGDLYIDSMFDKTQRWIWTMDKCSASRAWSVFFYYGCCYDDLIDGSYCVRAVR